MPTVADMAARLLREAISRDGPVEPTQHDWDAWVELAMEHRLLPLLHSAARRRADGLLPEQADEADSMQIDAMTIAVRTEFDLVRVFELLRESGIEPVVVKGVATAHLDYESPTLRQFADADLLVDGHELERACGILRGSGWRAPYVLPRGHEEFAHAITLRNDRRSEIDLHRRLAHRGLGELIPTAPLLANRVELRIAGRELWALSQTDRLLHASAHAVGSQGAYRRLSSVADVLVLAEACADQADEILDRADRWSVMPVVAHAVTSSYRAAQLAPPDRWRVATERASSRRDRLVEYAYLGDRRHAVVEEVAYLRLIPTMRQRFRYLRGYLLTGSEYRRRNDRRGAADQLKYLLGRTRAS